MSELSSSGFAGVLSLYAELVKTPETAATADRLYPGWHRPADAWVPDLGPLGPYTAVAPEMLGLAGFPDFHAIPDERLATAIETVIRTEGPVHFAVIADRLLTGAGVGRLGSKIRAAIETQIAVLADAGRIEVRGPVSGTAAQHQCPRYRDWAAAPDKTRDLEQVSDAELGLALFRAVMAQAPISADAAMNEGIAAIGFPRLTESARARLAGPLEALCAEGWLMRANDALRPGQRAFQRNPASQ